MSLIKGKFIESNAITADKVRFLNNEFVKARNAADDADVNIIKVNASDLIELATDAYVGANKVQTAADKGVANGLATLDGSGLVPASQLPSYVDDVLEFADLASFPATGETGKIYVALDTLKTYRWSGSAYVEISASAVDSVNGATGVVVLDTDDISEGAANFYYTESRFDTSLAGKSTTNLTEGTNLYFTDARAKTAAVVNSTAGSETDQAPSVSAIKAYVDSQVGGVSQAFATEKFTLDATDVSNSYVDLANTPVAGSIHVTPKGGLLQDEGTDYTVATNRITFAGDLATLLVAGDILMIKYAY